MIKVTINVSNPVATAATYSHIQIGKAANEADANSQTGTFTNLAYTGTLTGGTISVYGYAK